MTDNDKRMADIRERLAKAAPGPWVWEPSDDSDSGIETADGCLVASVHFHGNVRTVLSTGEQYSHNDARFIANAPADITWLLARIADLEHQVTSLTVDLQDERADKREPVPEDPLRRARADEPRCASTLLGGKFHCNRALGHWNLHASETRHAGPSEPGVSKLWTDGEADQ